MPVVKKQPASRSRLQSTPAESEGKPASKEQPVAPHVPLPGECEWDQSPSIAKLAKAFVAFRKECPNPSKDKQGFNYSYVTLTNIIDITRDVLRKHSLAVTQFPISSERGLGVVSCLMHDSGEYIRSRFIMPIPSLSSTNVTQDGGAAISYARRYALSAILGMAPDEDTDASYEGSPSRFKKKK